MNINLTRRDAEKLRRRRRDTPLAPVERKLREMGADWLRELKEIEPFVKVITGEVEGDTDERDMARALNRHCGYINKHRFDVPGWEYATTRCLEKRYEWLRLRVGISAEHVEFNLRHEIDKQSHGYQSFTSSGGFTSKEWEQMENDLRKYSRESRIEQGAELVSREDCLRYLKLNRSTPANFRPDLPDDEGMPDFNTDDVCPYHWDEGRLSVQAARGDRDAGQRLSKMQNWPEPYRDMVLIVSRRAVYLKHIEEAWIKEIDEKRAAGDWLLYRDLDPYYSRAAFDAEEKAAEAHFDSVARAYRQDPELRNRQLDAVFPYVRDWIKGKWFELVDPDWRHMSSYDWLRQRNHHPNMNWEACGIENPNSGFSPNRDFGDI